MIKIIFTFILFIFVIPYSYSASYECPYIENEGYCQSDKYENTCDGGISNNSRCKYYIPQGSIASGGKCSFIRESCNLLEEELEGYIRFLNSETGRVINTVEGLASNTPLSSGETGEAFANEFINKNIEVQLICDSCSPQKYERIIINENSSGEISLDYNGQTLSKKYRVWKIDKTPPVISEIMYNPSNDIWINGSKTATLVGRDDESWLIGESSPSVTCSITGGCSGLELSITDSAGNISTETFSIGKIDTQPPTIDIFMYADIVEGKQKIGITCNDTGGSGCSSYNEEVIKWFGVGTEQTIFLFDNAGNRGSKKIKIANSESDFSDKDLEWTNGSRYIYLNCNDDHVGSVNSGCEQSIVDNTISTNTDSTTLTVRDNAGNSVTKEFEIFRIDKDKPIVTIDSPDEYKATDTARVTVNVSDDESGVSEVSYNIGGSCKSGNNLTGTGIINGAAIIYNTSGTHTIYACAKDNAGNIKQVSKSIKIYPGDLSEDKSSISVLSTGDKYANNSDYYEYILTLKDKYENFIYNKIISFLDFNYFSGDTILYIDEISNNGEYSTNIYDYNSFTDDSGETTFKVKSYTPGEFSQKFKLKLNTWGDDYVDDSGFIEVTLNESNLNRFLKPISGSIDVIGGGDVPEVGIDQKYKIDLTNIGSLSGYSNGELNISTSSIINDISGHFWDEFKDIDNAFGNNISNYIGFVGLIGANDNVLKTPRISSENIEISYEIGGNFVKYYLDDFNSGTSCELETLGLKVYGDIQGDGKSDITGQEQNFSDLTKLDLRTSIRKNAYKVIKNMDSGDVFNGVKYVDGDVTISGNLGYETLIVTNGNVFISGDLNTSGNKLGIIVLKDNYKVTSDYDNFGNIYVSKSVENINAIIYADGTFRSSDQDGNSYNDSSLDKQLKLKGSLFTRNTIGGAVNAGGEYLLPGGEETEDFDLAEIYDLNYVRKVPIDCVSGGDNYSFIIEYDNSIIINPPKGFSN